MTHAVSCPHLHDIALIRIPTDPLETLSALQYHQTHPYKCNVFTTIESYYRSSNDSIQILLIQLGIVGEKPYRVDVGAFPKFTDVDPSEVRWGGIKK